MQPKSFFWTLSHSAFSIAASMSLLAHLEPQRHLLLFGVVFGTAIHLMSWPLFGWIRECQPRVSIGKAWSTALVLWLAGFALTYAIPVPMPHGESAGKQVDVQVSALGPSASGDSKAAEVWFAIEANGSRVPLDEIQHAGNWQAKDGMLYATQAGGSAARWSGKATSLQVVLLSHPWSGRAVVRWNGESREIDLHKETPGNATTSISLLGDAHPNLWMTFPDRTALQRAVQLLDAMLIAFVLYVLQLRLVGVARIPVDEHGSMLVQSIRYALPSWTVSACLLLVFWPGLMSNDSVAQWRDAATGVSSDWHPVYHTLFIALARAIWDSPSFIAMLQAGALGLSTGWLIAVIEKVARTPKSVSHLASWCCGLMPIIAFSSISLWKDVPYAASVVAITAGSLSVLLLGKPRLSHPLPFAATLAILLVCILFRHNGPPLAATALAMVFLLSKANRKAVAVLALVAIGAAVLLKGPVSDALGVKRSNVAFGLYAHHIAAHLEAGDSLPSPAAQTLFRQVVTDRATWPYSCGSVDATIFNPAFDRSVAAAHSSELRDAWLDLARSHPVTEFRHLACVSSLVWLMDESGQPPLYEFGVNVYPIDGQLNWVQNGSGLEEASMTPRLAISIGEWLEGAKKFNILWRPAGWLYLLLFATWVASRRMRDWRIATLCIPILAHSAVLALANVAQDVRYQLPVFIISLACVPALLVSRPGSSTAPARPLD